MHAPAFDYDAVTRDMPEARVKRGENYADKGWASLVDVSPAGVLAHVLGEQGLAYVVEVSAADGSDGRCTCSSTLLATSTWMKLSPILETRPSTPPRPAA